MKFVYSGPYTQFMGRTFAFGKPVEITDKATIEALKKRSDFSEYREPTELPPAVIKRPILSIGKRR